MRLLLKDVTQHTSILQTGWRNWQPYDYGLFGIWNRFVIWWEVRKAGKELQ